MKNITNYHVITVKYSGATDNRGSRILMRSDRFHKSKSIPFNHEFGNTIEGALDYLIKAGFEIVGKAEGKDCYYVISSTFESL